MSLYLYDQALYEKLKSVYPNVEYTPVDEFPETPKYPLVTVYRLESPPNLAEWFSFSEKNSGYSVRRNTDNKPVRLRKLSFSLQYQVDIYSDDRHSLDDLYVELLFFLLENPKLSVTFPYDGSETFSAYAVVDSVVNNTDLTQEEERGRRYRYTITLNVVDAAVFKERDVYMEAQPIFRQTEFRLGGKD